MRKVVVIGGGTGTYTLLTGLKHYPVQLSAIISMFDSGGSTGRLRDEFGELPKGDVRRCLIALSQERPLLRRLFEYRFNKGKGLDGHSFGNLFLSALRDICGSEQEGIAQAARLLGIKGEVIPVTFDNRHLCAQLENGHIVRGETNIDIPKHDGRLRIEKVFLDRPAITNPCALEAIRAANAIIIGPGDLYTSVLPNFLTEGLSQAVRDSHAKKIFVCNLMTKFGETNNYTAKDFLTALQEHVRPDYLLVNSKQASQDLLDRYAKERSYPVQNDLGPTYKGTIILEDDLIREPNLVRHDPEKVAWRIMRILKESYINAQSLDS